jgi:hypothetical protein
MRAVVAVDAFVAEEGFFLRSESDLVEDDVDAVLPRRGREDGAPSSSSGVGVEERDEVRECEPERMEVPRRRFSETLIPCLYWLWL